MAAVTAAVAVGAGMAYSANRQGAAAKKAANAQGQAAQAAMSKFDQQYDQARQDASGWLTTGQQANDRLRALMNGDMSTFKEDPGYQFRQDQGLQALTRMAAARGNYRGGRTDADIMRFSQGLASDEYNNVWNRNYALSNQGLGTAQYLGGLGQNYAQNWGNAMGAFGDARAQRAAAGPMTQAGYGNALASAFSTYAGMGGGGGGFGGGGSGGLMGLLSKSGYQQQPGIGGQPSLLSMQANSGIASPYNFGNNVSNFWRR